MALEVWVLHLEKEKQMAIKHYLILVILFLLAACNKEGEIITFFEEQPQEGTVSQDAIVELVFESKTYTSFCVATAIHKNVLITAAHCINMAGGEIHLRRAGEGIGYSYKADAYIYPGWDIDEIAYWNKKKKDIALIVIRDASWTGTNSYMSILSGDLKNKLKLYLYQRKYELTPKVKIEIDYKDYFTAGSTKKAYVCFGDSGGPAFKNKILYGVLSAGHINKDTGCSYPYGGIFWTKLINDKTDWLIEILDEEANIKCTSKPIDYY